MKKLLLETSFSKIYMIVMILISVLLIGGYFSYAMFTVSKEKSNAISIVTGNLTYKLEVDGEEGNTLTVPSNSSKEFIITLSNPNNRVARFNFYYLGELKEGVDTGYIEEDGYNITPESTGINLEKADASGSSNTYIIRVSNITDSEVTINLGVSVGLDYNDLSLPDNGHLFRKIINRGTVSEVIEDDIMNRLNYADDEQTFVTGEEPYNYIWYSGKLWRVVSIDPSDNSVKLVTQWNISAIPYDDNNSSFSESYMETWLNDESVDGFLSNLRDPDKFIKMDSVWNATMTTDYTKPAKTTLVTNTVGLLNVYEYVLSYKGTTYEKGYLNDGLSWWTLTISDTNTLQYITSKGEVSKISSQSVYGIRPSINLKSSIKIVDGRGTEEDPYRLEGDNDTNLEGILLNTRYSGEYISFGIGENNLYRIVSHETEGLTKVTSDEPLKENNNFKTSYYSSNANINYSSSITIGYFLNNDYLNTTNNYFTIDQINMIEDNSTWYLGNIYSGTNYRLAKYTDVTNNILITNITSARVGLLRVGELMAGQFNEIENNSAYWSLTPFSSVSVRYINNNGSSDFDSPSNSLLGIKPSLNLKLNVIITGGDGTKENPFELSVQ